MNTVPFLIENRMNGPGQKALGEKECSILKQGKSPCNGLEKIISFIARIDKRLFSALNTAVKSR